MAVTCSLHLADPILIGGRRVLFALCDALRYPQRVCVTGNLSDTMTDPATVSRVRHVEMRCSQQLHFNVPVYNLYLIS